MEENEIGYYGVCSSSSLRLSCSLLPWSMGAQIWKEGGGEATVVQNGEGTVEKRARSFGLKKRERVAA